MMSLAFIFVALAGIARAVHTSRKDHGMETEFLGWFSWISGFTDWYIGGNERYMPSSPFKADFWHFFVFLQVYCWSAAVLAAAVFPLPGFWVLLYLVAPHVEGWFFTYFYHYVFPLNKVGNFRHFLRRVLTFTNDHAGDQS